MLKSFVLLAALALFPSGGLAYWGELCKFGPSKWGNNLDGVCVWESECKQVSDVKIPGKCPNDPEGVKCCNRPQCVHVEHGRCPGPANIKYIVRINECWEVESGQCPGGPSYMKMTRGPKGKPLW